MEEQFLRRLKLIEMHACSFQTVKKFMQSIKPKLVLCKLIVIMYEATELQQRFILSLT